MKNKIRNLFFATRVKRILPVMLLTLIPLAITNNFLKEIILLEIIILLVYSSASIQNAIKDKDFLLPKNAHIISILLIILAILISLQNKFLLLGTITWILLGLAYNYLSRKVPLGDAFIAGFTHFALPILIASLLVNLDLQKTIAISLTFYLLAFSIGPLTNLKDIKEDQKRKYQSLVSKIKNPIKLTKTFLSFSIIIFLIIFKLTNVHIAYILISLLFLIFIFTKLNQSKLKIALNFLRFYLIINYLIIILALTRNKFILINAGIIFFISILTLNTKWKNMM